MQTDLHERTPNVMVFGVGSFAQSVMSLLKKQGAAVSAYLIRDYAHYGPSLEGPTFDSSDLENPCQVLRDKKIDLVIPMSIDWVTADWAGEFLELGLPILSPNPEGMALERDRDFAQRLCRRFDIPFPKSYVAQNRLEAENILKREPLAYVIKNPLCSPTSPIHTIVCKSVEDTRSWLHAVNYEEGVFLQEYMGPHEAGHIAFVSNGQIFSLVTNQEYKWSFDGNMGIVAGAPLGGLVEKDPGDKYGFARELLYPLLPWFEEVGFSGPVQVTAIRRDGQWYVLEYNVRIGVTSGPIIIEMLQDSLAVFLAVARKETPDIRFRSGVNFGCSLTLAGYGYPYARVESPGFPVSFEGIDCDLWWNEVRKNRHGRLVTAGQRIADVVAIESTLEDAIARAYGNISKINCLGSYYRTDIGESLWPPGT